MVLLGMISYHMLLWLAVPLQCEDVTGQDHPLCLDAASRWNTYFQVRLQHVHQAHASSKWLGRCSNDGTSREPCAARPSQGVHRESKSKCNKFSKKNTS